jgi:hypothetical protein
MWMNVHNHRSHVASSQHSPHTPALRLSITLSMTTYSNYALPCSAHKRLSRDLAFAAVYPKILINTLPQYPLGGNFTCTPPPPTASPANVKRVTTAFTLPTMQTWPANTLQINVMHICVRAKMTSRESCTQLSQCENQVICTMNGRKHIVN